MARLGVGQRKPNSWRDPESAAQHGASADAWPVHGPDRRAHSCVKVRAQAYCVRNSRDKRIYGRVTSERIVARAGTERDMPSSCATAENNYIATPQLLPTAVGS